MTFSEEYEKRIKELFEQHPTVQTTGFSTGAYKPGLAGMEALDGILGHPWNKFRSIHVAGTNGKGSVSSMLAASIAASGLKTGLYTSPHLIDFRERIKVVEADGFRMIGREEVMEFLDSYSAAIQGLSFFEITTGMAFWWFSRQNVDFAVIEVGLGGRLDSTNIITPVASVVTSIGLDHCAMLGGTRALIAGEKAGIFKPGVPAVVWGRDDETAGVFTETAERTRCPLTFASEITTGVDEDSVLAGMDLEGPCQKLNLHTVLATLSVIGMEPDIQAIRQTAARTGFLGRWQKLCDNPEVICDIGHNPAALRINFGRLEALKRPLVIVYGIMADKDLDGISALMPSGAEYILAAPATARSLSVENLHARLGELRPDLKTRTAGSVREAVNEALEAAAKDKNTLVYIGGSTFVVSEAYEVFHPLNGNIADESAAS